jgi:TonB family protein
MLLSACSSVDPAAKRTEQTYIARVERQNTLLESGSVPVSTSDRLKKAQKEVERLFPDLAARYEALRIDSIQHKITYPRALVATSPNYPPGSEYLGTEGTVYVAFVIGIDGRPRDVHVLFSPEKRMTASVLRAVEKWRFTPALIDGKPAEMAAVQPVQFALR